MILFIFVVIPTLSACSGQNAPQPGKPIEMSYATSNPTTLWLGGLEQEFLDKLEAETDGQVHFTGHFGGSLITDKTCWQDMINRVADMGNVQVTATTPGFDLNKFATMAFIGPPSLETVARVRLEIDEKFPELIEEYSDVKHLYSVLAV